MEIFEDTRVVSRADLAVWLRQLAGQLESGQIFYRAAGTVTVADQVRCELEIERESGSEISVEIEFTWSSPEAAEPASTSGEADTTGEEDEEEQKEAEDAEKSVPAVEAVVAGEGDGDNTAARIVSTAEGTTVGNAEPSREA